MGMFDYLEGTICCPKCNKRVPIDEQIKWADCTLNIYKVGSKINTEDGLYHCTPYRNLVAKCKCGESIYYVVEVKNGIISDIRLKE